ncbi:hypothetical protein [Flavobacterium foetidum]|uniref:hypothetical protein n=1 Tax=Flavobacterium foetidum TaxID=2026681 RepID=UPI001074BC1F|nr:hypothetical protein [Flavobacterium foetidum]KAF2514238.1 hypothetical protein E0W73_12595 [Flavobacterium foetidum]
MTKKIYILSFLITIGFFLIPTYGYSCGRQSEKISHKKEINTDKKEKDCCTKSCCKETSKSKKKKHNCDGKCSHSNCTNSSFQLNVPALTDFTFQNNFNFSIEKSINYYNEANISAGFTTIWSPPKI